MGIFTSFATGFLEGSVQVAKEKKEAQLESDRISQERKDNALGQIVDIMTSKNPNVNLATYIGQQAGLTNLELSQMTNMVNTVDSSIYLGNSIIGPKPEKWDEKILAGSDNPLESGGMWLQTYQNIVATESGRKNLLDVFEKDPNAKELFVNQLMQFSDYYVTGQRYRPGIEDVIEEYTPAQEEFKMLFDFVEQNNVLSNAKAEVQKVSDESLINTEAKKGNITNSANSFVVSFFTGEGKKDGVLEFSNKDDLDSIARISTSLGYATPQEFISNYKDVDVASTVDEAYGNLLSAIEMERKGFGTLASGSMAGSTELRTEFADYVKEEFGGDMRAAIRAYAPLVTIKEDKNKIQGGYFRKREVKLAQPEDYFTRNKLNKQQVMEQYEASLNTMRKLNQLYGLLVDNETPTGLKAKVQGLGFAIFGEGGQIDQFFGSEFEKNGAYADGTDAETLKKVAIDRGFISKETAQNLSTMDALKLSLAAEMARAVDPSGRLSNQDFEIQLRRLGEVGWFSSKVQSQASLQVVIDDFQRTRGRLETLYEVATQPKFTIREARMLRADQIIRSTTDANFNMMLASTTSATGEAAAENVKPAVTTNPSRMVTPDNQPTYRGSDGKYYLDPEGKQPVDARTLKDPKELV